MKIGWDQEAERESVEEFQAMMEDECETSKQTTDF